MALILWLAEHIIDSFRALVFDDLHQKLEVVVGCGLSLSLSVKITEPLLPQTRTQLVGELKTFQTLSIAEK